MDRGRRGAAMFDFDFALLDESPRERFHAGASLRFASEDACYVLWFFQESISTNATKNSFARGLQQMSAIGQQEAVCISGPLATNPVFVVILGFWDLNVAPTNMEVHRPV